MAGPPTVERGERQQPEPESGSEFESGSPAGQGSAPPRRRGPFARRGRTGPPRAGRVAAEGPAAKDPAAGDQAPGPSRALPPTVRRRRLAALVLLLALLGGFFGWVLYGSSWLRVQRVGVSGTRVLTPGEVRAAAAVRLGSPLISVDTDAIAERLRRALPRIDSVVVDRSWPHAIGLKVTERTPALLIEKGRNFIEVDAKGVRFATVPAAPAGVPTLELATNRDPSGAASLRRFGPGDLVRAAVRVAGDLPAPVARQARVLQVRSYDSISVELSGERIVDWGSSERGAQKGRTLAALMKAAPHARHFDVSAPTAPAAARS